MAARVLLTTLNSKYIHTNLAIRILYQLNKQYDRLIFREFTIKQSPDDIAATCTGFDIVAFSCYIWNIRQTLDVCGRIKRLDPAVRILLGGPEVSYDYEDVIARGEVDFIIPGEGEQAFREFLKNHSQPHLVPGLVWKHDGKTVVNPPAAPFDIRQMADIMPYAADDPATLIHKVLYIETSRGCPYKCGFCLASLDNKVRYLPDESIRTTLLFLMKHGKTVKFLDRTFNIKRDFTIGIFEFILEHHQPGNVFQFEITADILHPDIIRFIREKVPPGLFRFEIGIQTVNQQANLAVKRKQNFEKTRSIILQLNDHVEMHLDLIVGLPHDTMKDIRHSIEEVFALHPPELQLGFLKFLKGTPVRNESASHGYVFDPEPPYQIIRSNYLSEDELQQITFFEEALEYFWNGRKATNVLKYIGSRDSIFDFLSLLGKKISGEGGFTGVSLENGFRILFELATKEYGENSVAAQLAAIDYYLHYHHRPGLLFTGVAAERMASHKTALLNISFDFEEFRHSGTVSEKPSVLTFRYDGIAKPGILQHPVETVPQA